MLCSLLDKFNVSLSASSAFLTLQDKVNRRKLQNYDRYKDYNRL